MTKPNIYIKIASTIFKKVLIGKAAALASAYEIYSIFDTISDTSDLVESINDCNELSVSELKVVSDVMSDSLVDQLIRVGSTNFEVQKTKSGIYIASNVVRRFPADSLNFPSLKKRDISVNSFPAMKGRSFPKL
ncbi:MAG: hypothetical protein JEZ14_26065 [Marinilabiliaceae bacterium]|nr:hypothetical protein [Marinilabiliaceae bacterium]